MLLPFKHKSRHAAGERLSKVMRALDLMINDKRALDKTRAQDLDVEYDYIQEATRWAKMLSAPRKVDPELAAIAAALQNIGRIVTGQHEDHAESGYQPAKRLLTLLGCFQPAEIEQIATAVRNHSRREIAQGPLDELVKDVDVYVRYIQGNEVTNTYDLGRLNGIRLNLKPGRK